MLPPELAVTDIRVETENRNYVNVRSNADVTFPVGSVPSYEGLTVIYCHNQTNFVFRFVPVMDAKR